MMFDITDNFDVHPSAYLAAGVTMYGRVTIGAEANIWDAVVLRGDLDEITIGARTSIQEHCVIHVGVGHPTHIGDGVLIGHGAVVDSATVKSNCLIGINATVLAGAVVEEGAVVGAGAVVSPGMIVPAGSVAFGVPAKVVKPVSEKITRYITNAIKMYVALSQAYKAKQNSST